MPKPADDFLALLEMGKEIDAGLAVEEAEALANIKTLNAELEAIQREIEQCAETHRQVQKKRELLRAMGKFRGTEGT